MPRVRRGQQHAAERRRGGHAENEARPIAGEIEAEEAQHAAYDGEARAALGWPDGCGVGGSDE